jgi:FecR protein
MQRRLSLALLLLVCSTLACANVFAAPKLTQLAQVQPAPAQPSLAQPGSPARAAPDPAAPATDAQQPVEEPIGNVATVTGNASVVRNNETTPLKVKDDIYLNDVVQTAANSALGITFNDATTFSLKANAQITIDTYVYEDGGKQNAGVFDVAKGTVAFVAAAVSKTGDMKITTPTATLGIRGTTGLVEVPEGADANNPSNVAIKLYPDADGRVGRIEVNDRAGARLGFLTQGASGFTIRPGVGGARFAAVPLAISPQQMLRDQGFVRQVHSTQNLGRRVVDEQRAFRRANPGFNRGNAPRRSGGPQPNGLPGQNRTGQQPGLQNRPGQPQPGQQNRPGQQLQNRPGQPPQTPQQPGSPNRQGQQLQRPGQPQQPAAVAQPGAPAQTGVQQPGFRHGVPGASRPGLATRPGLRLPPKGGKPPPKERRPN